MSSSEPETGGNADRGSNFGTPCAVFRPAVERAAAAAGERPLPDVSAAAAAAGLVDIAYVVEASPVGPLLLAATRRGLVRIAYLEGGESGESGESGEGGESGESGESGAGSAPDQESVLNELARTISPRVLLAPARLDPARRELDEFFAGRRLAFDLALDWRLVHAGFTRRVLRATARIPYGSVSSYGAVAAAAGSPRASRAAGTALGGNPLPIVVPCHRILHAGGGLGGYAGGLDRKRVLLDLEHGTSLGA